MTRRFFHGPDHDRDRYGTRDDERSRYAEPRGDYVCVDCGSDRIEPRRMRSDDRFSERDEYRRRGANPREHRYDYRYDDTDDYRGGDWGRDDVYPYSRSAMSGYEEPWHRGYDREHSGYDYGPDESSRDFDERERRERAFLDERAVDYRLRERDHYDLRDEDERWRR